MSRTDGVDHPWRLFKDDEDDPRSLTLLPSSLCTPSSSSAGNMISENLSLPCEYTNIRLVPASPTTTRGQSTQPDFAEEFVTVGASSALVAVFSVSLWTSSPSVYMATIYWKQLTPGLHTCDKLTTLTTCRKTRSMYICCWLVLFSFTSYILIFDKRKTLLWVLLSFYWAHKILIVTSLILISLF